MNLELRLSLTIKRIGLIVTEVEIAQSSQINSNYNRDRDLNPSYTNFSNFRTLLWMAALLYLQSYRLTELKTLSGILIFK